MSTEPGQIRPSTDLQDPQGADAAPAAAAGAPAGADAESPLLTVVWKFLKKLGPAGALGVIWTAAPPLAGVAMITWMPSISNFIQSFGPRGIWLYVGAFIITAGLGLMPTYTQAVLAGWCFGLSKGFAAAELGFVGASLVGYAVARTVARHRVEDTINENPKAAAVRDALIGHGWFKTLGIVTLLRIPPNSPFALTNLVMASTGVPLSTFVIGTALGMAPRTFIAVYIGHAFHSGMSDLPQELGAPLWVKLVGLGVSAVVFAIIVVIARKAIAKVASKPGPDVTPAS